MNIVQLVKALEFLASYFLEWVSSYLPKSKTRQFSSARLYSTKSNSSNHNSPVFDGSNHVRHLTTKPDDVTAKPDDIVSAECEYAGDYWNDQYRERFGEAPEMSMPSVLGNVGSLLSNQSNHDTYSGTSSLTHTDSAGKANMVDVSGKLPAVRIAKATAHVSLGKQAYNLVRENQLAKGDVLSVARIAGITGAKKTSGLIPLCHSINLSKVSVDFDLVADSYSVVLYSEVKTESSTGVEMEALTAVSLAALTIYDMCKAITHDILISDIKLLLKTGGESDYNIAKI